MAVRKSSPYGEFTLFYAGSPFCNFTKCTFEAKSLNGSVNKFCNSEQYFMYNKALVFDNKQIAVQILAEKDPAKIKAYGRQVRGLDRDIDIYTVRKRSPYGDLCPGHTGPASTNVIQTITHILLYGVFTSPAFSDDQTAFFGKKYNKALVFDDKKIAAMIMAETNPDIIKGYGRQVRGFDDQIWNSRSNDIMEAVLRAKYSQNPNLRQAILDTNGSQLVECSPTDQIWGIGLPVESPDAMIPPNWRGANRLGKALDKIRDELLREERSR